jgi:broad specificity phosphatase PhoE
MMTTIVLVRHGHVEGIEPERFRGRADIALTQLGERQAAAVAARIAARWRPAAVYSSPLQRCRATAGAIARACAISIVATLDQLVDIDYGEWQWRTREEIAAAAPQMLAMWDEAPQLMRFPGGESLQELAARAADVVRRVSHCHPGAAETIVLVGHDSINRAMLLQMLDQPLSAYWRLSQSPCAINQISVIGRRIRVLCVNDASHLDTLGPG